MSTTLLSRGLAVLLASGLLAEAAPAQTVSGDSTLAAACTGGTGLAEGLLVIVFDAKVPAARRNEVVRAAGGRRGGPAEDSGVLGEYVLFAPDIRLDLAADQLIRAREVQSVGEVRCPPPPSPPAAADTIRRPDSTSAVDSSRATPPGTGALPDTSQGGS